MVVTPAFVFRKHDFLYLCTLKLEISLFIEVKAKEIILDEEFVFCVSVSDSGLFN